MCIVWCKNQSNDVTLHHSIAYPEKCDWSEFARTALIFRQQRFRYFAVIMVRALLLWNQICEEQKIIKRFELQAHGLFGRTAEFVFVAEQKGSRN